MIHLGLRRVPCIVGCTIDTKNNFERYSFIVVVYIEILCFYKKNLRGSNGSDPET